jgi:hypothetical protein
MLAACGSEQVRGFASPATASSVAASTSAGPTSADPPPPTDYTKVLNPGWHGVGWDVQPGTYTTGPSISHCYWARLDVMRKVIEEHRIAYSATAVTVTVLPTDSQFYSEGCGQWQRVG